MARFTEKAKATNNPAPFIQPPIASNYTVCFQLYEKKWQYTELSKLKKEQLQELEKLLLEVLKCTDENEFMRIHRGINKIHKKSKFKNHPLLANNKLIHIGKDGTVFRLHGLLIGTVFKLISIDPEHQEHKIKER